MKKILVVLLSVLLVFGMTACGEKKTEDKTIDKLTIAFVPSKDPDEILTAAKPLEQMLKTTLAAKGYTVNEVAISVGTNYNAVGEGMIAGTIDIGFIPAATYVQYHEDGVELLLEALRYGICDEKGTIIDPKLGIEPWNAGKTAQSTDGLVTGYASLIYVNIDTEKGADLYNKAVSNTLTWEDVDSAEWYVCSTTSSAGYVYPSIWLNNMFGEGVGKERKIIANLSHVTGDGSYSAMIPQLIAGGCDVTVSFADYRYNADANAYFEEAYKDEIAAGKYTSIYDIIKVIGVSDYIMNDTISVASEKVDPKMTPEFVKALQEAFMEIGSTPEGLACVQPYSHMGYRIGQDSDYDSSRAAAEILKNK